MDMYDRDVPIISAYVEQDPDNLVALIVFVLCTIQSGLATVKKQMDDVKIHGEESRHMWFKKGKGLIYAQDHASFLWNKLFYLRDQSTEDPEVIAEAIELLIRIPNIAIVKAGFICQCIGFNVACIDVHNSRALNLKPSEFKINDKMSKEKVREKIFKYIDLCQEQGAKYWWDTWCVNIAGNQANRRLKTGEAVSAYHSECVLNF